MLVLGYAAYMLLRQVFPEDLETVGRANAARVIDVERALGIYWEPAIQSGLLAEAPWVVTFFNWAYSLGFLPVLVPGALILMTLRYDTFIYFRRVFLISYVMTWALWLTVTRDPTEADAGRRLHRCDRGHGAGLLQQQAGNRVLQPALGDAEHALRVDAAILGNVVKDGESGIEVVRGRVPGGSVRGDHCHCEPLFPGCGGGWGDSRVCICDLSFGARVNKSAARVT